MLRTLASWLIAGIILIGLFLSVHSQSIEKIYMVYDKGIADSQIMYSENNNLTIVSEVYLDHDLEGIACVNNSLYLTSGKDGKDFSSLYSFENGKLEVLYQTQYKELSSLTFANGKFYSFADEGNIQGLVEIDPISNQDHVLFVDNKNSISAIQYDTANDIFYLAGMNRIYAWKFGDTKLTQIYLLNKGVEIESMLLQADKLLLAGDNIVYPLILDLSERTSVTISRMSIPNDIEDMVVCVDYQAFAPTVTPTSTPIPNATPTLIPIATEVILFQPTVEITTTIPVIKVNTLVPLAIEGVSSLHVSAKYNDKGVKNLCYTLEGVEETKALPSLLYQCTNNEGNSFVNLESMYNYTLTVNSQVYLFETKGDSELFVINVSMFERYFAAILK